MTLAGKLEKLIKQTELQVTQIQLEQLINYVNMLCKWNKAYNLTSVRDPNDMLIKHIMDSIVISPYLQQQNLDKGIIDIGTGPGLPGIPLAILNPTVKFTLLDSLGKRIRFLTQVKHELKLNNVNPVQSRVEQHENKYSILLSRAFASITDMIEWSQHLTTEASLYFALKGQIDNAEIEHLPSGNKVESIYPLIVPKLDGERHLVIIRPYNS